MNPESAPLASGEPDATLAPPEGRRQSGEARRPARPRALYVWQADYPWDVRVEKTANALKDVGFDTHIVARNRRWAPATETFPEGTAHRLEPWRWAGRNLDNALQLPAFFSPRWMQHIAETARQTRPSIIIARDIPLAPTALWIGRRLGIPVVLDIAENYPAMLQDVREGGRQRAWDFAVRNPRVAAAIEAYCVRRADHVVVVVEENADRLAALGVRRDRLSVVSNTPPRERALRRDGHAPVRAGQRLQVVYLGILEIPRGLYEAIDAVEILRSRSMPVRLTIVGDGRDAPLLRARARDAGLTEDDVVFTGYVPRHEDALGIVAASDVGIAPFHKTGQWQTSISNKLFDYMAAGLAVVTSDTAPSARIVRETCTGEVFRAGEAADLAAALVRLADPAVRTAAGEAGRRSILTRYNWERDAEVFCRAVEAVVRDAATGRRVEPHA